MAVVKTTPTMVSIPNHFCPGCGHGILNRLIAEVIEEKGYEKKTILTLGVGCSCNMNGSWNGDKIQTAHGRAASTATGVKVARPDLLSIAYQGDGDAYVIGLAETLNAAYRSEPITVFVINNNNFAMTGGQMSPCTLEGAKTATTPYGRRTDLNGFPLRVANMVSLLDGTCYVTRQAVHTTAAVRKAKAAIRKAFLNARGKMGTSFVEVVATCSSGWKMSPAKSNQWMVDNMFAHYPLGDIKDTTVPAENAK